MNGYRIHGMLSVLHVFIFSYLLCPLGVLLHNKVLFVITKGQVRIIFEGMGMLDTNRLDFSSRAKCCALVALVLLVGACSTVQDQAEITVAASDVSFLIALKAVDNLNASTVAAHGVLMPRAYFDRVEALTRIDELDDLYDNLDVVGVRLDPCFFEGTSALTCEAQVRVVLQPVFDEEDGPIARDGTIHAFYAVQPAEVQRLAQQLAQLRIDGNGSTEIGLHSAPNEAAALLLPYIGAERLTRLTFVSVHASDQAWSFGGFDVIDGELFDHSLIGVDAHEQHLTSTGGTEGLDATILPSPLIETDAASFMEASIRETLSTDERELAHESLRRLMDPRLHNTGTVDCATCHMATAAAYAVEGHLGLSVPDVYSNSQNQRMFGFFGRQESISPRVNAETDVVLEAFETLF